MTDSRNVAIAASIIVLSILAIASNAGAALIVNEISGTFGAIGLDSGDPAYFELTGGVVSQTADAVIVGLELADIAVDVTGWTADGDDVAIDSSTLTIQNLASGTTALFSVDSATLTQILTSPLGIGYMELDLSWLSSDLTYLGDDIVLPSTMQMFITYTGLVIETDGSDGIASLNVLGSASFSAIPEPATLALLLGGFALVRKRRNQVSIR